MSPADWSSSSDPEPMLRIALPTASHRKRRLFACACCRRAEDWLVGGFACRNSQRDYRGALNTAEKFAEGRVTARELCDAFWQADDCTFCNEGITDASASELRKAQFGDDSGWLARMRPGMRETDRQEMAASGDPAAWIESPAHADWLMRGVDPYRGVAGTDAVEIGETIYRQLLLLFRQHGGRKKEAEERAAQAALVRELFGDPFPPAPFDPAWHTSTVIALARGAERAHAFDRLPILADAIKDAGCNDRVLLDHLRGPAAHVPGCWALDWVLAGIEPARFTERLDYSARLVLPYPSGGTSESRHTRTGSVRVPKKPRRLEFTGGHPNRFWEVSTAGHDLTVRWGSAGTKGQSRTKPLASAEAAVAEATKLIQKKLEAGYTESARPIDPEIASSVRASWTRIDRWLARHAPSLTYRLHSGASPSDIAQTECILGLELPDDVRASYMTHNGCANDGLFPSGQYLSLDRMVDVYTNWERILEGGGLAEQWGSKKRPLGNTEYNLKWIPLTYDSGGDHLVVDLEPASGGQLIDFCHETGLAQIAAPNLAAYLVRFADALEARAGEPGPQKSFWDKDERLPPSAFLPPTDTLAAKRETSPAKRYFEFTKGTPYKFWEVAQVGSRIRIRDGQIGRPGDTRTKSYRSPQKATAKKAKFIAEKVKEGYVEHK